MPVRVVIFAALAFVAFGESSDNLYSDEVSEKPRFVMNLIAGSQLFKLDNTRKAASEVFAENDIVLIYISAHWCPPCRRFTPKLKAFYEKLKQDGKKLEVIFMSSDKTEEGMINYMKEMHGDWFAAEYGTPVKGKISAHFGVKSIPFLIVLSGSGRVISTNGRKEIDMIGESAWDGWTESAK